MKNALLLFLFFPFLGFSQLSGNYVINSSNPNSNFKTLAAAVNYINSVGVKGPVTFLLDEDQTVSATIVINQFSGSSSVNTLTIKPNDGKIIEISAKNVNNYTSIPSVIQFNGADHIIIDGSNAKDGTSRDLTLINNDEVNYVDRSVLWIASNNSNGAVNINIKNIILKHKNRNQPGKQLLGIYSGNNELRGDNSLALGASSANNAETVVANNEFLNVRQGIYINSSSVSTLKTTQTSLISNKFGGVDDLEKPSLVIKMANTDNFFITDNRIEGVLSNSSSILSFGAIVLEDTSNYEIKRNIITDVKMTHNGYNQYAILVKGTQVNSTLSENKIFNIKNTGGGVLRAVSFELNASSNNLILANNFISDVITTGTTTNNATGLYIQGGTNIKLYYNSVILTGKQNNYSAALHIAGGSQFDIRNNIFGNESTSGTPYAVYSAVANTVFTAINNNDYFADSIGFLGSAQKTLADWKKATGKDAQSISVIPAFVSGSDLHLQNVPANNTLQGISIAGITKDIDGDDRLKPYMGADEIACLLPAVTISVPSTVICPGGQTPLTFTATSLNSGTAPTYQWKVNGTNVGAVTGSNTFTTTNLALGDVVTATVYSSADCSTGSSATSNGLKTEAQTTVFNGSWSVPPAPHLSAEIRAPYSGDNLDVCTLLVTNNAPVTINTGNYFKVYNGLKIDNGSSLTIESDGNLIQVNESAGLNTGTVTAKRNLYLSAGRQQYNYLMSPLEDYSMANIYKDEAGNAVKVPFVLYHNESSNTFSTSSGAYIKGRGLAVKEPEKTAFPLTVMAATFVGKPANGAFTYPIVKSSAGTNRGYNLIGNPYPSSIDLEAFYRLNSEVMESTVYFWDNQANSKTGQEGDKYGGQAYATYNLVSRTGLQATGDYQLTEKKQPSGYVKSGQGFMVKSKLAATTIRFSNTIRTNAVESNGFFGKNADSTAAPTDRFWLNMISPANISSNIAVVYLTAGNNGFGDEDSRSMGGSDALYSLVESEKVAINGRSSFAVNDRIALGSQHFTSGNYTIAIDNVEGVFANGQNIYLKDYQTGIVTNLNQGAYSFTAAAGESAGRFEILYQPETVLGADNTAKDGLSVYRDGASFILKSENKRIDEVQVFNAVGQLTTILKPQQTTAVISTAGLVPGVYVLKVTAAGKIFTRKIIIY